ncbi:Cholesterol 7-alpha-monooxygenase [Ascochyta rabiei]|uniref:Heme binding n=1 Tax=Didymella rabiei TaxID=5454 RepID=A0A163AT88_DIDRA|nr:Cholesterol 7-alpha-monooxygenase [Ascochyta rabiei]KZM21372.1 heme binding [Ascochyta rabiei]UPX20424.1 Cholesterol 7-alpha-monooxygenase [Ascochyta rabiei]
MSAILAIGAAIAVIAYTALRFLLHATQSVREPRLVESRLPFLDSVIGIARQRADYLANLGTRFRLPVLTLRMPFQRLYVVHAPNLIQVIQSKANAQTFVPNLLDFGMLFSGLNTESQNILRSAFGLKGNGFTMSVHKYLLSGPSLKTATKAAVDRLTASVPNSFTRNNRGGLQEMIRHELTLALTGAIYGPENPYDDPAIEASWRDFVPGINHLLYSLFPALTARKALRARDRIVCAFKKYFETSGHLQAFPMVAEMHELNKSHGLTTEEAAKMEMATSLAMLSSGAVTSFWLMYHILSDEKVTASIREELESVIGSSTPDLVRAVNLGGVKDSCPTLVAMLNETLRYHSTVINIKQVQHDTTLAGQYLLKKNGIVMIPGRSVHHNKDIWGPSADAFDHHRFLSPDSRRNVSSTSAFRPFGAGTTMCPGRHFSTNVTLSLAVIILLRFDVVPMNGEWRQPTKRRADMWNAMPKPDQDIDVRFAPRGEEKFEWKFLWE